MDPQDSQPWLTLAPWMVMASLALPFVVAAWRTRTFPTTMMLFFFGLPIIGSVLTAFWNDGLFVLLCGDALLLLVFLIDFVLLPSSQSVSRNIKASREHPRTISISQKVDCALTLSNRSNWTFQGRVVDDLPQDFDASPRSHALLLPPQGKITFHRKLTSRRRGAFQLEEVFLETRSRIGLWKRYFRLPLASQINVFPDMRQLSEYALLARTDRLSLIGVRRTRRIGQDSDFERLRDYTPDDNYRHIDWRTTARRNKLTVREYQSDQSQRVMFLLDCGRMMTNQRAGMSLLDHSLNAALMLSYVALVQGDAVGMLCFSDSIHSYLPPRGGRNQLNRILQAGFDQFPRMVESRYDRAFLHLSNHCRRRTLVVLLTNIIDEVNASQVVSYLGNLVGRHLPLGVLIRDAQMFNAADNPSNEPTGLYQSAVAAEILCWRDQVIHDLRHRGSLVLDVFPEQMTAPLVNEYLQAKANHLL